MPRACNTLSQRRTKSVCSCSFGLSSRFIPGDRRSGATLPSKQAVAGSSFGSHSLEMHCLPMLTFLSRSQDTFSFCQ